VRRGGRVTNDEKIQDMAAAGIEEAMRTSTVGIVAGVGKEELKWLGTGVLVKWKGKHLIVTAQHVIGDTPAEQIRFFLPTNEPPKTVDRETLQTIPGVETKHLLAFSQVDVAGIIADKDLDLAAVVLTDGDLDGNHPTAAFVEMADGVATPPVGDGVMTRGFPHDMIRYTTKNAGVVFMSGLWTAIEENVELQGFDPEKHFLAKFDEQNKDAHPLGFSGGAMWFRRGPTPTVWMPNIDIAGINVSYYASKNLLKVVRREVVEQFLRDNIDVGNSTGTVPCNN
jgi:hypothetical protein